MHINVVRNLGAAEVVTPSACPGEATAASDTSIDLNIDEIKAESAEVELTLKEHK